MNFHQNLAIVAVGVDLAKDDGGRLKLVVDDLNLFFTLMFTVDLALNLFANWFLPFVRDFWSVFDFVIVSLSLVAIFYTNLPAANLFRAFRILRLLSTMRALEKIIWAVSASIFPMINAFMIVFVFGFLCNPPPPPCGRAAGALAIRDTELEQP